jgi:hypothetical protein
MIKQFTLVVRVGLLLCISTINLMVTYFSHTCKEAPLTEIEKDRARTMMRNNRVLQSLGIPAVVSIFRKSHGGRGGGRSTLSNDESSAITQGKNSDYHPSNDQLVDQEDGEVEGSIGEHIEKVHSAYHLWSAGIICICFLISVLL